MISPKKKSPSRTGLQYSGPDLDSPSRQKISLLADKWSTIETGIDKDKKEKKDTLAERVDILESVLVKERPRDDQKFKVVKDQILKVQENAIVNATERENFDAKKDADLQTLQDTVSQGIGQERKLKQGSEARLMSQTDERFTQLASIASRNKDAYNERMNTKLNLARTQVGLIKSQIEGERKQREEGNDQLAQQIDAEIKSFQDQLLIEKKVREETQQKIFRMIEEIHTKLSADIVSEKKERSTTVDALLKLLEDACVRVNQAFK